MFKFSVLAWSGAYSKSIGWNVTVRSWYDGLDLGIPTPGFRWTPEERRIIQPIVRRMALVYGSGCLFGIVFALLIFGLAMWMRF